MNDVPLLLVDGHNLLWRGAFGFPAAIFSRDKTRELTADGVSGEITISKTFKTSHGDVTLVLGADGLDEVGFITDFGDLKPFGAYLQAPAADAGLRVAGPALVAHLAGWFIDNAEPEIRSRLVSVRVVSGTTTCLWERGDAS